MKKTNNTYRKKGFGITKAPNKESDQPKASVTTSKSDLRTKKGK